VKVVRCVETLSVTGLNLHFRDAAMQSGGAYGKQTVTRVHQSLTVAVAQSREGDACLETLTVTGLNLHFRDAAMQSGGADEMPARTGSNLCFTESAMHSRGRDGT